jgi:hypothetical protein
VCKCFSNYRGAIVTQKKCENTNKKNKNKDYGKNTGFKKWKVDKMSKHKKYHFL